MKRLAPALLALTSLTWSSLAGADSHLGTTTAAITGNLDVFIGGDKIARNSANIFIGKSKCTAGVELRFQVSRLPMDVPVLELWVSRGTGNNCFTPANRQGSENTKAVCRKVAEKTNVIAMTVDTLAASALDLFSENGEECVAVTDQAFNAYLVPLASPTLEGTGTAPEVLAGTGDPMKATFTLYTQTPSAPRGVEGSSGEAKLGVEWNRASGANEFTKYRIYYDTAQGGAGDAECGSGVLQAGEIPSDSKDVRDSDTIAYKTEENTTSGSISGSLVETGESVAVGVAAVDAGGNESQLSEIVCIERVDTRGFIDGYEDAGGNGLEKCSMQAPGRASWSGLGSLTLLALALVARRRRTA